MPGLIELQRHVVQGDRPGPHLLITGGVHGDEFEPMVAIRRLIATLSADELRGRVTLVPVVNEPAYERCHRTGPDGLDLARTCPGRRDGSITEQIADAVSTLIRSADFYIDLHTGGTGLSVWPLAGYTLHSDPEVLEHQRRMARAFNLPVVWGTWPGNNGRTLSVARDAGVPAIYAEYLGAAVCDPAGVEAYVDGCLNVLDELQMRTHSRPEQRVKYEVEDPRPDSGHLQICYPSPQAGYFETAVRLGQPIEAGALLGTVSDVLGRTVVSVYSQQTGIVLVLRTFPRVEEGDSLAVVVETGS